MRISVTYPLESRDGTLAKDAKLKNMVTEIIEGKPWAVKRPGITHKLELVNGGIAQGLIALNGVAYSIVGDIVYYTTLGSGSSIGTASGGYNLTTNTPITQEINIGTPVVGSDLITYYAMIDNPVTPAGAGDPYWSTTPPDSKRYRTYSNFRCENANFFSVGNAAYADIVAGNVVKSPYWILGAGWDSGKDAASIEAASEWYASTLPKSAPGLSRGVSNSGAVYELYFVSGYSFDDYSPVAVGENVSTLTIGCRYRTPYGSGGFSSSFIDNYTFRTA